MELIAAGALIDKALATDGCSPLYIAAQNGHLAVVTKLVAAGALVDKATAKGYTPLFIAAANGHLTVVSELIAAGAVVDKAETPHSGFRQKEATPPSFRSCSSTARTSQSAALITGPRLRRRSSWSELRSGKGARGGGGQLPR